ncbi:hypothetical protein F1654_06965 [Alkalicaulis satelles]|uniref:Uncharacterized protein n=1 Tax=Alkalicaulis satelles TaxID=2609175 RepID=A0A5M6ZGV2_9PROT|nr:hypothetical protein [Alkalicaulis satelles]KAA5803540.1 hypothetical protein F1654_06965 [Alkalicaulis satelles]
MTAQAWLSRLMILAACAALVLPLGACGVRGGLERPAPLWGEPRDAAEPSERDREEDEDEVDHDEFLDPDDWEAPG